MRTWMFVWIYLLPIPLCAVFYAGWLGATGSARFALFALLLPVLYGYVVPGIATNIMKKWRFRGPWLLGNYYPHHGFKYAAHLNLSLFLAFGALAGQPEPTPLAYLLACLATGCIEGFIVWLHDTLSLKQGLLEIDNPFSRAGCSPEQVSFQYAPTTFFLIGLSYAMAMVVAHHYLVIARDDTGDTFAALLVGGFVLMAGLPSAVFGWLERRWARDAHG